MSLADLPLRAALAGRRPAFLTAPSGGAAGPAAADPAFWRGLAASSDPLIRRYRADVVAAAAAFRRETCPPLPFSLYRRFDETGDRLAFEAAYFGRRRRLVAFALAYLLERGGADLAALEDTLWAVDDEYAWALPAHLGGRSLDAGEHATAIDLFAAETAFALAEIVHLLRADLAPAVVRRSEEEVRRRVLAPFAAGRERYGWESQRDNWAAVCAGSVGAAALYLVEDDAELAAPLERLLPCFGRFLDGFAEDGACLEGLGYWTYGFGFFAVFADLLAARTGGGIDLMAGDPKIRRIAGFQAAAYLNDAFAVAFADGSPRESWRLGLARRLAARFGADVAPLPPAARAAAFGDDACGRWCLSLRDLVWGAAPGIAPAAAPLPDGPRARWFADAQWLIKPGTAVSPLAFAAKGGRNDEPHNHNDIGAFMAAAGDDLFIVDLGAGEYTKDYFSARRYEIFGPSSLSHSVPIVDGRGQLPGGEHRAEAVAYRCGDGSAELAMDIQSAYGDARLRRLTRRFAFGPGDGAGPADGFRLVDEYEVEATELPLIERFATTLRPELDAAGAAVRLRGGGGTLSLCWEGPLAAPEIRSFPHRDHEGGEVTVWTIDFAVRPLPAPFACSFRFGYAPGRS
jgi:hypothetical protein